MTTREAIEEIYTLLPSTCLVTTTHWEGDQLNRIDFLLSYIRDNQPADPDWDAMAKAGEQI